MFKKKKCIFALVFSLFLFVSPLIVNGQTFSTDTCDWNNDCVGDWLKLKIIILTIISVIIIFAEKRIPKCFVL